MSIKTDTVNTIVGQEIPRVLASREEALAAVAALCERIAARAEQTEKNRSVPEETIRELTDAGLFGIVTPRMGGGSELGFATLLEVQSEIASACASTGWVYGVLAGHTWLVALFSEKAQAEVFADPRALVASLIRFGGEAPERVEGGFRWRGGRGRFCSGIDHSQWVLLGGTVTEDDGTAEQWYLLVHRSEVEIVDDWHAVGLKGTGSKSIVIKDAFIPEHRAVRFADLGAGRAPGAELHMGGLYRLAYDSVWPLSLAGAVIGAARGALEEFTAATSRRLESLPPLLQASNGPALARLAKAAAQIDAMAGLLRSDALQSDNASEGTVYTPLDKARRSRNLAFAAQQLRASVNDLYESAGGSGVYTSAAIQRWWRDVNAAASHVAFTWDLASVAYGRQATGIGALSGAGTGPAVRS
ncbi:3-hydroxy-9,10-secoandrosta-1,3,5(10)-triene-9,17-dione monooxygenase [Arthrobacter ginsengisoli]|uniref:3-hydroxy-9,10-secoandrosta-1,3,5(10)-triene-9, 17-dione monooxygenase n=1 Tax=Arthrobacter ginsengisoli TaxID=1356565 RepID=A0ABU1UDS2_9MICC|nr:acyl-CoA dehydrogenase family protein [Arthrobacter ginsengisoli]MDR7083276.1 3-hydroxy-9,10-secoandrosta-1,3,5(10)-triene-9,17-dione monooxygenase [Arthrobacter ginsengisoli]